LPVGAAPQQRTTLPAPCHRAGPPSARLARQHPHRPRCPRRDCVSRRGGCRWICPRQRGAVTRTGRSRFVRPAPVLEVPGEHSGSYPR
ncbi:MAG: hypothetical protein ACRDR6_31460, partial [Pseudonocardiaceae bacterium]